jgi:NAD+ synthase
MDNALSIDTGLVKKILTEFIRSEIGRAGFSRAVVNLSGGIDSAVSFALAAGALGPQNVLAVRLPYKTSSADSLEHAQLLIDQFGSPSVTIPITGMVDPFMELDPAISEIRKGNLMARARMIVAYDQSEAFKALVIGTGNKTEILLGYTTLYGDSACALNPIGDLYKTQVRQLARALQIPEVIISKPLPTRMWTGCSIYWLTNAIVPKSVSRPASQKSLSTMSSSGSAATSSNASCLPSPNFPAARSVTISCTCGIGELNSFSLFPGYPR